MHQTLKIAISSPLHFLVHLAPKMLGARWWKSILSVWEDSRKGVRVARTAVAVLAAIILFIPGNAYADSYIATGFGTAQVNDCYDQVGTYNGQNQYWDNTTHTIYMYYSGTPNYNYIDNDHSSAWYYVNNTAGQYDLGTWVINSHPDVAGTVSYSATNCPEPPKSGLPTNTWDSISATSSIDQIQENLYHGIILFLLSFSIMIFYFKKETRM